MIWLCYASDSEVPELLPIGYLVGDTTQIGICLKGTFNLLPSFRKDPALKFIFLNLIIMIIIMILG